MGTRHIRTCHKLNVGSLELRITEDRSGRELFRVAERINPKRSFLFVSTVLGRHIPVRPSDHFSAIDRIVDRIPDPFLEGRFLVMGYAETAVGIGAAVARRIRERRPDTDPLYLSTTRHPVAGREWIAFSEDHSHATTHHVMDPVRHGVFDKGGVTLVLVDDETTTGGTFAALFEALREGGLPIRRVFLLTLTDWSGGLAYKAVSALAPALPVKAFSLMSGLWKWTRDPTAALPAMPGWPGGAPLPIWSADVASDPILRAPRLGIRMESGAMDPVMDALPGFFPGEPPVLVIGTGEHVWGPMLLAERLERDGADVHFVATTRSPILAGDVISRKVVFPDHFGIGVPMYLHNVPEKPDARVIIMTETGADGICASLRSYLGRGHIIDGSGGVTEFRA